MSNADSELLDYVKTKQALKSDTRLAGFLGISRATITKVRAGERKLGFVQRLKIADKAGFLWIREIVEEISSEKFAESIRSFGAKRAKIIADQQLLKNPSLLDDSELIDIFKASHPFRTDQEMAEFLGVPEAYVSQVRTKKTTLSNKVKLRILSRVLEEEAEDSFDLDDVEYLGNNPDALLHRINKLDR